MKSLLTTVVFALFATAAFATDDMQYDAGKVNQTFSKLDQLEQMHHQNPAASLDELKSDASFEGVRIEAATLSSVANAGDLPILPAFWWGCILGAIGILLVYLITEDKDQAMKALYGCLAWVGFWILYWVFWVLVFGGSWWW
jgi:hypothetical protein